MKGREKRLPSFLGKGLLMMLFDKMGKNGEEQVLVCVCVCVDLSVEQGRSEAPKKHPRIDVWQGVLYMRLELRE